MDGTKKRIVRPGNPEVQEAFSSGKVRAHTVKNIIVAGLDGYQVKDLSGTSEGKRHDKKIADEESIRLPLGRDLYRDAGFQGQALDGVPIHQPKKNPRGGTLTLAEKEENRLITRIRVAIEHVIAGINLKTAVGSMADKIAL